MHQNYNNTHNPGLNGECREMTPVLIQELEPEVRSFVQTAAEAARPRDEVQRALRAHYEVYDDAGEKRADLFNEKAASEVRLAELRNRAARTESDAAELPKWKLINREAVWKKTPGQWITLMVFACFIIASGFFEVTVGQLCAKLIGAKEEMAAMTQFVAIAIAFTPSLALGVILKLLVGGLRKDAMRQRARTVLHSAGTAFAFVGIFCFAAYYAAAFTSIQDALTARPFSIAFWIAAAMSMVTSGIVGASAWSYMTDAVDPKFAIRNPDREKLERESVELRREISKEEGHLRTCVERARSFEEKITWNVAGALVVFDGEAGRWTRIRTAREQKGDATRRVAEWTAATETSHRILVNEKAPECVPSVAPPRVTHDTPEPSPSSNGKPHGIGIKPRR